MSMNWWIDRLNHLVHSHSRPDAAFCPFLGLASAALQHLQHAVPIWHLVEKVNKWISGALEVPSRYKIDLRTILANIPVAANAIDDVSHPHTLLILDLEAVLVKRGHTAYRQLRAGRLHEEHLPPHRGVLLQGLELLLRSRSNVVLSDRVRQPLHLNVVGPPIEDRMHESYVQDGNELAHVPFGEVPSEKWVEDRLDLRSIHILPETLNTLTTVRPL